MIALPTIQFVGGAAPLGVSPFFFRVKSGRQWKMGNFRSIRGWWLPFFEMHRPACGAGSLKS